MSDIAAKDPLDVVARKIMAHASKADDQIVAAALLMQEARRRVDAGEAGDVTWSDWSTAKIGLSASRLRDLQRIADAEDPHRELERQREATRKRVERHRASTSAAATQMDQERKDLIAWAIAAPIDLVRQLLDLIREEDAGRQLSTNHLVPMADRQEAA